MKSQSGGWKNYIQNWKLKCAAVLIFLLCGPAATLHIEPRMPIYDGPTTISNFQVSGANVAADVYTWSSNIPGRDRV